MSTEPAKLRKYQELRPAELEAILAEAPVAYWPLGMLEHHGWHLPIGFDGLKVEELCGRMAAHTGGVLLPTLWWAAGGGHGNFPWTHYQSPEAVAEIVCTTVRQLAAFGFKVIVVLAGHYPWQPILDKYLPTVAAENPGMLLLWGSEATIGAPQVSMQGDHAGREETSTGLYLFPELVDMDALCEDPQRTVVWPGGQQPLHEARHSDVCYDAAHPCFAQAGVDARQASREYGRENLEPLMRHMVGLIEARLKGG